MTQKKEPNKNVAYRQCTKCVLDTNDDPDMTFDEQGVCDYYYQYLKTAKTYLPDPAQREHLLEQKLDKIKKDGAGKEYDVVVGLSGGVDSTFVALLARAYGLRVLGVHLDNGWNSELAVNNIESIVTKLDIDLFTYVIDWEEFVISKWPSCELRSLILKWSPTTQYLQHCFIRRGNIIFAIF